MTTIIWHTNEDGFVAEHNGFEADVTETSAPWPQTGSWWTAYVSGALVGAADFTATAKTAAEAQAKAAEFMLGK